MAISSVPMGKVVGFGGRTQTSWRNQKQGKCRTVRASAVGLSDGYRLLNIQPGASERDVKKAFRRLALQYHPDVCKANDCRVQFHRINEAYDMVLKSLREEPVFQDEKQQNSTSGGDQFVEDFGEEEWIGCEGGWVRDYSSIINSYINNNNNNNSEEEGYDSQSNHRPAYGSYC